MHIYNRKSKKLKSFSDVEVMVDYFKEHSSSDKSDLFFWNFGMPGWRLASDILSSDILKSKSFDLPEFPPDVKDQPVVRLDPVADGFKVIEIAPEKPAEVPQKSAGKNKLATPPLPQTKPVDYSEQRRFKRYETRLKVIVSNKQKTFLSYSKNISEGGILLEDRIPSYMFNEESEIFISAPNKKEIIAFRCLPLDDENPNRLKFQQSQVDYIEKLKVWLEGPAKTS